MKKNCRYNLYSGVLETPIATVGTEKNLTCLLSEVNVFLKAGSVIPLQGNLHVSFKNVKS